MQNNKEILTNAHSDYGKMLNQHANFKLNNSIVSEDLVQETYLKTWKYLVRGGEIKLMKAFLYHILNNLIIDEYRRKKAFSLEDLVEKGYEPSNIETDRFIDFLDGRQAMELISKLPIKYIEIMKLKYIDDLSLDEIAIKLKLKKNTVSVHLFRGLLLLRKIYLKKSS